jgi:putative ABC transport system ATP-binding protein
VTTPRPTKRTGGNPRTPGRKPSKRAPRTQRARPQPILAARNLVKDYKTNGTATRALDGVSMDVPPGRFISVMGPSGSGKSTLLHLLGGLDTPTAGEVLLQGKPLSGLPDREVTLARRGSVGFVFQFFNLVPVLTVAENIALPRVIAGDRPDDYKERLDEVVAQIGLEDCVDKLPSQISGGQQQRTAVARAIFPKPAVVLGDEPTGNLDTRTGRQVLELLKSLQTDHGQTIVIVTHDPRAAAYGDEVMYLEDGKVRSRLEIGGTGARRGGEPALDGAPRRSAKRGGAPHRSAKRGGAIGGEARAKAVLSWLQKLGA